MKTETTYRAELNPGQATFLRRWVAALRSGDYGQCNGALCRGGDYCCLGVAAELLVEDGVAIKGEGSTVSSTYLLSEAGSPYVNPQGKAERPESLCSTNLLAFWRKTLGINEIGDTYNGVVDSACPFMSMNDHQGKSFAEIADIIEGLVDNAIVS